jgi:hypothetical protein
MSSRQLAGRVFFGIQSLDQGHPPFWQWVAHELIERLPTRPADVLNDYGQFLRHVGENSDPSARFRQFTAFLAAVIQPTVTRLPPISVVPTHDAEGYFLKQRGSDAALGGSHERERTRTLGIDSCHRSACRISLCWIVRRRRCDCGLADLAVSEVKSVSQFRCRLSSTARAVACHLSRRCVTDRRLPRP